MAAAAEGPVPQRVPVWIEPDDPKIVSAKIGAGFGAVGAGSGQAAHNGSTVAGLLQAGEEIVVRAAERQVPQFVAIRIQTHQPIVGQANYGAGLVAVGAENRISTQDKSATTDLLKAIQGVAPAAAEGP